MASKVAIVLLVLAVAVAAQNERRSGTTDPICFLPPLELGINTCRAAEPKFTYNARTGKCERFTYGGCGGTANLFNTLGECEQRCRNKGGRQIPTPRPNGNICLLPLVKGRCEALSYSYGFVAATNSCQRFEYGGCGANANNFETKAECERRCLRRRPVGEEE